MTAQIEHNQHEKRPNNTVFWILAIGLSFSAVIYFLKRDADWWALGLGAAGGMALATWAIEMTGNKVPDWMRSPPRR